MTAFLASLMLVVLAEMGDKTQLLALAFATRYRPRTVLAAVFLATLATHGLAVAAGHALASVLPMHIVSFCAAASFVVFGLWTLRCDALRGEERRESRFGPLATVGIAFFLAEMGDKTQLATVSLAVEYRDALSVLAGTTLGMVIADAVAIGVGAAFGRRLPERTVRYLSAAVFVLFGFAGMFDVLSEIWGAPRAALVLVAPGTLVACVAYRFSRSRGIQPRAPISK